VANKGGQLARLTACRDGAAVSHLTWHAIHIVAKSIYTPTYAYVPVNCT
jgi:hypothetical protein